MPKYKIIATAPVYLDGQRCETSTTVAKLETEHPIAEVLSALNAGFIAPASETQTETKAEPVVENQVADVSKMVDERTPEPTPEPTETVGRLSNDQAINDIGLEAKVAEALVAGNIQTVGEARMHLVQNGSFKDLAGIGKVTSDLIVKMIK